MSEPTARTVEELITQLLNYPSQARVQAYEGEDIGIAIETEDGESFFIKTPVKHHPPMSSEEFDAAVARRKRQLGG